MVRKETSSERGENPHYIGWHGGSPSHFCKTLFIALKPHVNGGPWRMRGHKDWIMKSKQAFFIIRLLFYVPDFNSLLLWCEMAFYYPSLCIKLHNQCRGLLFVLLAQAKCTAHPSWYQILLMLLLVADITTQLCVMWAFFTSFFFDTYAHYVFNGPCRTGQQPE